MDVDAHRELLPAPAVAFETGRRAPGQPRFMVRDASGAWQPISWAEHNRAIGDLALYLRCRGLTGGDRAAIFATNRVAWMQAALAIQMVGAAFVPIYPASTADQAAYVLMHSGATMAFVASAELLERLLTRWDACDSLTTLVLMDDTDPLAVRRDMDARGVTSLPSEDDLKKRCVRWNEPPEFARGHAADEVGRLLGELDLDDRALLLYTSGTTGQPKGVPLSHRNLAINTRDWMFANAPLLREGAIDLLWLPLSHVFGYGEACIGDHLGFVSYMSAPATVLDDMPQVRPNVFLSVPAYWEKIAKRALESGEAGAGERLRGITGGRLEFCLSGGAGLDPAIKEFFRRHGVLLLEGYGLTECSPTLTLNRYDAYRFDSVGKPLESVEIRLAEDAEILARGPNIFSGYHHDPEATAAAFTPDGWFKTGDIGRFTEDGFLQIVDRKKDILVTAGGKNVAPANIEQRFASDPLFAHVVAYGDGKKYVVAGVWLDPPYAREAVGSLEGPQAQERLEALVRARIDEVNASLASFEQIKRFAIMNRPLSVEGGLLTSTLKIRRKQVWQTFAAEFEGLYA